MTEKALPACPVETTLTLISDKWKVLILRDLLPGTRRFGELKRSLSGVSQMVLTAQDSYGGQRAADTDGIPGGPASGGVYADGAGQQPAAGSGGPAGLGRGVSGKKRLTLSRASRSIYLPEKAAMS